LAQASEIVSNQQQTHAKTSDRAKASAAIQHNLNKNLSTKTNKSNNNNVNKLVSNSVKDECNEPSESVENSKKVGSPILGQTILFSIQVMQQLQSLYLFHPCFHYDPKK
jgi:hypothetical protein